MMRDNPVHVRLFFLPYIWRKNERTDRNKRQLTKNQ